MPDGHVLDTLLNYLLFFKINQLINERSKSRTVLPPLKTLFPSMKTLTGFVFIIFGFKKGEISAISTQYLDIPSCKV